MPAPGGEDYVSENTLQVVRPAERGSMPYSEFLQALKDKRVLGVDFIAPNGDEAYALVKDSGGTKSCSAINPDAPVVDGVCRLRMGEGWPVEVSNSWSSPSWVVRILDNEQVPHALVIDLKKKPQRAVYPKAGGVAKL
ncbi:hypothetical protein EMIHUDRAFT_442975 [Emiliania huxleyi CCMP1516]|uniref:Uncharacterized protein n=3 Tax=Emiliania huxleyi TaxID=2903 RepID=A0A0D3JXH9_EMIH1|nr:hypothetical protein EMIHUDRAFT_442975 [Emiliania huxleyi CCMP1516]EOD28214.1 hypothetical protein EMIHUDRAFT_442975 [Emiliania huxleyi CCMP1516]|mmetsp:Transcript_27581/g.89744  ORF Transcript_27581/g.89744 Transcript_27581/m.89744 type:complete len:138 (-) Transcript_27581:716-1129(-)|eukprot:XP_005780643.1 hypothetical protein EMIHUDRAFT_442975 [Emiliania huxleyi CCMP1516]